MHATIANVGEGKERKNAASSAAAHSRTIPKYNRMYRCAVNVKTEWIKDKLVEIKADYFSSQSNISEYQPALRGDIFASPPSQPPSKGTGTALPSTCRAEPRHCTTITIFAW